MLAAPLQRKLPLRDPSLRVLLDTAAARAKLPNFDEDDVLALVEDGQLLAWDISSRPGVTARCLRIFPDSVDFYSKTNGSRPHPFAATWPALLLSNDNKPFLHSPRIAILLNCGPQHITDLIDDHQLAQVPGTSYRRGPTGAACITKQSFLQFLKTRII